MTIVIHWSASECEHPRERSTLCNVTRYTEDSTGHHIDAGTTMHHIPHHAVREVVVVK